MAHKRAVQSALVPPSEPADGSAPVRDVLERIGDKWSVIVICRLDGPPRRFNELRRLTEGITQRMLSVTLRRLERDGLVSRTVFPTVPPQVEYALTDRGRSLHDVLAQLVEWTSVHLDGIQRSRANYDSGTALARGRPDRDLPHGRQAETNV